MAWETVTDVNDGQSFGGAAWQSAIDAIEELQGVVGPDETVENATSASGTYTPTLTNITLGSGGVNTAAWTFVGGPETGGVGLLSIAGLWTLGTGGSLSASPSMSVPSGFQWVPPTALSSGATSDGQWSRIGSPLYFGVMRMSSATDTQMLIVNVAATYAVLAGVSGSVPHTWANTDTIRWAITNQAVRV